MNAIDPSKSIPVVFMTVGSDSDDKKVKECLDYLQENGVIVARGVKSIHRTPEATQKLAEGYPDLPDAVTSVI
jgi:phosphoribosylcarboxyaminoimidazole (NCAIR) mutase